MDEATKIAFPSFWEGTQAVFWTAFGCHTVSIIRLLSTPNVCRWYNRSGNLAIDSYIAFYLAYQYCHKNKQLVIWSRRLKCFIDTRYSHGKKLDCWYEPSTKMSHRKGASKTCWSTAAEDKIKTLLWLNSRAVRIVNELQPRDCCKESIVSLYPR